MKAAGYFHLLLVLLMAGGCALGTRHAVLGYPPEKIAGEAEAKTAEGSIPGDLTIVLVTFVDERTVRWIGDVRNGFAMKTATVKAENEVTEWLTEAIQMDLEAAGYRVIRAAAPDQQAEIVLTGAVLRVFCTALLSYDGEVFYSVQLVRDGKKILVKNYAGNGSAGMNWGATARSYSHSLEMALQDANRKLVADIGGALGE